MSAEWRRLWSQDEEPSPEERLRQDRCAGLERQSRWAFPGNVRVSHPAFGEIVVPGASPFGAIKCAAEMWGCDWMEIIDARVEADLGIKKTCPDRGRSRKKTLVMTERRILRAHYRMGTEKREV